MNKKYLPIVLFVGIGFLSIGLGSFKASNEMVKEAKADDGFKIDYNGASITLGMYPNMIVYESEWAALEEGKTDLGNNKYEYEGNFYSKIYCIPSAGILPGNITSSQIWHKECWFKWETIEWRTVKEDTSQGITYFYAKNILDTCRWQSGTYVPANDWENSTMRQFLNYEFLDKAFDDQEKIAVKEFTSNDNTSQKELTDRVSLISKKELDNHPNLLKATPTGYAIGRGVYYWKFIGDDNTYATYYLNSTDNTNGDTNLVDIAYRENTTKCITTNETRVDCEIGVRPLIAIDNNFLYRKPTGGGGGGGSSVNVSLIIAIIFSVLGMAGVITFLTLWHKGKLFKVGSTKAPIWVIASISVSLVISIVGTCMLFANTGGQGTGYSISSPVGYWSCTYFTQDTFAPDFGYSYYLGLTKDFKVYRYISDYFDEDNKVSNPLIKPVSGIGSWSIKNKKLIINAAPEWELLYFEDTVTEYYATNGFGFARHGRMMNYGNQNQQSYEVYGYRWSHGSDYNPTGEAIRLNDVHFYDL